MPKIQIELSEEEDQVVEIYKAENKLANKEDAIKSIINRYKKAKK